MIENNRLFGAQHFFVYTMDTTKFPLHVTTTHVLQYYIKLGLVTIVPWPWPQALNLQHPVYNGQVLAFTDCLYRNLWSSSHITHLDLDEVMVARKSGTWQGLVNNYNSKTLCAIVLRNVFFFTIRENDNTFSDDPDVNSDKYQILSLLKTLRNRKIWGFTRRSKYIAMTKSLIIQSVHKPTCIQGTNTVYPPTDAALLHHYRQQNIFEAGKDAPVADREMHKYNITIKKRFIRACRAVGIA